MNEKQPVKNEKEAGKNRKSYPKNRKTASKNEKLTNLPAIKNTIADYIRHKEQENALFKFQPTLEWYRAMGVGKRSFQRMMDNVKQPDLWQLKAIAVSFRCQVEDLYQDLDRSLEKKTSSSYRALAEVA